MLNMGGPTHTDQVHDYLLRIMTDQRQIAGSVVNGLELGMAVHPCSLSLCALLLSPLSFRCHSFRFTVSSFSPLSLQLFCCGIFFATCVLISACFWVPGKTATYLFGF